MYVDTNSKKTCGYRGLIFRSQETTHCVSCSVLSIFRNPVDCSPPGSSVHGILQARILEWIACPSPGNRHDSGIKPVSLVSCIDRQVLYPRGPPGKSPLGISNSSNQVNLWRPWVRSTTWEFCFRNAFLRPLGTAPSDHQYSLMAQGSLRS